MSSYGDHLRAVRELQGFIAHGTEEGSQIDVQGCQCPEDMVAKDRHFQGCERYGIPARIWDLMQKPNGVQGFPVTEGDVVVLGPEVFIASDGSVISYKGQNYYPRDEGSIKQGPELIGACHVRSCGCTFETDHSYGCPTGGGRIGSEGSP